MCQPFQPCELNRKGDWQLNSLDKILNSRKKLATNGPLGQLKLLEDALLQLCLWCAFFVPCEQVDKFNQVDVFLVQCEQVDVFLVQ